MKRAFLTVAALAFGLAMTAGDVAAKATYGDPSADIRTDAKVVDVGDRASTYEFASPETLLGSGWIGGSKRPADLKAILASGKRNSRLDTESELAALLQAARAGTGSFAFLGEKSGAISFSLTNKNGTVDVFNVASVSAVPLPGAVWLLGSAFAGLAWARRRRT